MARLITALRGVFPGTVLAALTSTYLFAQVAEFDDGTKVTATLHKNWNLGPPQSALLNSGAALAGLPYFTLALNSFGTPVPITFLGTDPSVPGAGTTTIPTTIIPLIINFLDGSGTLDATGIVANTVQSPLFTPVDFTVGGIHLGTTQYGDAVQRGEFWSFAKPDGGSPNYHVLLGGPTVLRPITINVPVGRGHLSNTRNGIPFGRVDIGFWEPVIFNLLSTISATPNQMPIFLAENIGLYIGTSSNCCVVGYHNSTSGQASVFQTWIYGSWLAPNLFSGGFEDLVPLSHEISEWVNDPFVGAAFIQQVPGVNWVPPFQLPGQGGACQANFETGDVLEALPSGVFTMAASNGFTYHLQDAAFIWYFLHTIPSPAVNASYTLQGVFPTPALLCGAG